MEPVNVRFLFDFGSPNAYLVHRVVPAIEARGRLRFDYEPVLLGGLFKLAGNRSPIEAYAGIPNKLAYERLEMQRFVERHRIGRFRLNPHFPVNTLKIMRGAVAARRLGVFETYVEAMYAGMWEDGRNLDDPQQITNVMSAAGLDAAAVLAESQVPDVKAELVANTQQAFERGAFGSPSFLVGDALYFGKERLRDIEDDVTRRTAAG